MTAQRASCLIAFASLLSAIATAGHTQSAQVAAPVTATAQATRLSTTIAAAKPQTIGVIKKPPVGPIKVGPMMPINPGSGFLKPQQLTAPYGLQTISGNVLIGTSTTPSNGVFNVQSPSLIFDVPISANQAAYRGQGPTGYGGLHFAYKSIGWKGVVWLEVCLTTEEASAWPGAEVNYDPASCPQEDYLPTEEIRNRAWYVVASASADMYVVQNQGFSNTPIKMTANLQQITAPARLYFNGATYYYNDVHTGPNDAKAACPFTICRDMFTTLRTNSFKLVVMPAALIQLKVLPETIVYLPPGNSSFANYKITATYSTTIAAGSTTQIDNSTTKDDWTEMTDQSGLSEDADKIYNFGYSSSTDTRWDTKTTLKTGQAMEHDIQGLNQQQIIVTRGIKAGPQNVPGHAGLFANEPFQSDLIVVLVHPQLAVWDFYGKSIVQLIAANGGAYDTTIAVSDLSACAKGTAPFPNGYVFQTASHATVTLAASECLALARLDPFFGFGQSASVVGRGLLIMGASNYGTDVTSPAGTTFPLDIQTIASTQQTTTDQSTQTYAATAEDIVATTQSSGINFGVNTGSVVPGLTLGFTDSIMLKQGSSTDTAKTMTLTYKNSTVATQRQDIAFEGSINDTVNRGYTPLVEVYRDKIFGGLMFRDPAAQCSPQPMCQFAVVQNGEFKNAGVAVAPR